MVLAMNLVLLLEKVHGHIGVLVIALALHPWFSLRRTVRPSASARIAGYAASALIVVTNLVGWIVYPSYREDIKPRLYAESELLGNLFEFKEHLAWFCLCLAVVGAGLMVQSSNKNARFMRSTLRSCYLSVAGLAAVSAGIGIYLASVQGF